METIRNPENLDNQWGKIFQFGFGRGGMALSVLAWVLLVIWLSSDALGGFAARTSVLTGGYFNLHILFMSIAFLMFMTPASAAFETFGFARNRNKQIHGWFQTLAVICITVGYIIIYDCHMVLTDKGLANTMHAIVGYLTISLVGITYSMGFVLYVLKRGGHWRGDLKPLHKRLGMISLMSGYAAILMGLTEKTYSSGFEGSTLILAQVIVGLVVGTSICVSFSIVKFVDKKEGIAYKPIPNPTHGNTTTVHLKH
eukprot:109090_1